MRPPDTLAGAFDRLAAAWRALGTTLLDEYPLFGKVLHGSLDRLTAAINFLS